MKSFAVLSLLFLACITNTNAIPTQDSHVLVGRASVLPAGKCRSYKIPPPGKIRDRVMGKRNQVLPQDCDPSCKAREKVKADNKIHSSSCIAFGNLKYDQTDKDGDAYALGNCKCDDPAVNEVGRITVEEIMPAVGNAICVIWLSSMKTLYQVAELGTYLVPGVQEVGAAKTAMEVAVKAAKTAAKAGKKAGFFDDWVQKSCPGMPKTAKNAAMQERVWKALTGAPDSFATGKCVPNTPGCK